MNIQNLIAKHNKEEAKVNKVLAKYDNTVQGISVALGKAIETERKEAKLSRAEAARCIGTASVSLYQIERPKTAKVSMTIDRQLRHYEALRPLFEKRREMMNSPVIPLVKKAAGRKPKKVFA